MDVSRCTARADTQTKAAPVCALSELMMLSDNLEATLVQACHNLVTTKITTLLRGSKQLTSL